MQRTPRTPMAAVLDIWNGAPAEGLEALLSDGYRGHMLGMANGDRDSTAYPASIARYRAAFPGVTFGVVEQLEADGRLVTRLEARRAGTDAGPASVSQGINISRFDAVGRLAEEWAIWSPWLAQD